MKEMNLCGWKREVMLLRESQYEMNILFINIIIKSIKI